MHATRTAVVVTIWSARASSFLKEDCFFMMSAPVLWVKFASVVFVLDVCSLCTVPEKILSGILDKY